MINNVFTNVGQSILAVFSLTWWVFLPLVLFYIFWEFWVYYVFVSYVRAQKWVLLHVRIPELVEKTPKAMEQVFASMYATYSFGLKFLEKYWEGKMVEDSTSFEILGINGGIYFQIRVLERYRNIIESAIYSQYPDAEITQGDDLVQLSFPKVLPNKVYDLWGTDYHLSKEDPYPIRTHEYFEEAQKEKRLDPIAAMVEVMSKLKEGEMLWIQILIRPTDDAWQKKGIELRDKIMGRKKLSPKSFFADIGDWIRNLTLAPIQEPVWTKGEEKQERPLSMMLLSPGERDAVEAIENKIGKLGFETALRFVFVDRRDSFSPLNVSAMMGAFNQFNNFNLNSLRPNLKTITQAAGIKNKIVYFFATQFSFIKRRVVWYRKRRLWESCIRLYWPRKRSILHIEELATIDHIPSIAVESPLLRRVLTKKGEPPAGLPTD